jgi:hypothetical protein
VKISRNPQFKVRIQYQATDTAREREVIVDCFPYILGRNPSLAFTIEDSSISSQHASLEVAEDGSKLLIRDLGSRNGLRRVGGEKQGLVPLGPGVHAVQLGRVALRFEVSDSLGQFEIREGTQVFSEDELRAGKPQATRSKKVRTRSGIRVRPSRAGHPEKINEGPIIRFREPTGGIRLARTHVSRFEQSRGFALNPFQLSSERRGGAGGAQPHSARRVGDTTLFIWGLGLNLLIIPLVVLLEFLEFSPLRLAGGNISSGIASLYSIVLTLFFVASFSLLCVSVRYLFKRSDIDYLTLFKQVLGAHLLAYALMLVLRFFVQEGPLTHWRAALPLAFLVQFLCAFFSLYALILLRGREQRPGRFAQFFPLVAALLVAVLRSGSWRQEQDVLNRNLLVTEPRGAPFSESALPKVSHRGAGAEESTKEGVNDPFAPVLSELNSALEELDQRSRLQERAPSSLGE